MTKGLYLRGKRREKTDEAGHTHRAHGHNCSINLIQLIHLDHAKRFQMGNITCSNFPSLIAASTKLKGATIYNNTFTSSSNIQQLVIDDMN